MPPLFDANLDRQALRRRASEVFVNRTKQTDTFQKALISLPRENGPGILVFHGPSGFGKTALRRELLSMAQNRAKEDGRSIKLAQIDHREQSVITYLSALTLLCEAISRAKGVRFPAFNAVLEDYLHLRPGERPPRQTGASVDVEDASKTAVADGLLEGASNFVKEQFDNFPKDAAGAAAHSLANIGVSGGASLFKNLGLAALKGWSRSKMKSEHPALKELFKDRNPKVEHVFESFATILAKELAHELREPGACLVLFIDGYNRAKDYGVTRGAQFEQGWDKAIRKFFLACQIAKVPILFVLFSRDKTQWDRLGPDWAQRLTDRETKLSGLDRVDAAKLLTGLTINEAHHEKILDVCREGPSEDHYIPLVVREHAIRYLDTSVLPGPSGDEERKHYQAELAAYYVENADVDMVEKDIMILLSGASCCEIVDKGILNRISEYFHIATTDRIIDNLLSSGFFYKITPQKPFLRSGEQFTMPGSTRACFSRELSHIDAVELHTILASFMRSRAIPSNPDEIDDEHVDCLNYAINHAMRGGLTDLRPFTEGEVAYVYRRSIQ